MDHRGRRCNGSACGGRLGTLLYSEPYVSIWNVQTRLQCAAGCGDRVVVFSLGLVGAPTLRSEELAGDVEGFATDDDDLLAIEKLLRNGAGESSK
jgi:hypothetical protein